MEEIEPSAVYTPQTIITVSPHSNSTEDKPAQCCNTISQRVQDRTGGEPTEDNLHTAINRDIHTYTHTHKPRFKRIFL